MYSQSPSPNFSHWKACGCFECIVKCAKSWVSICTEWSIIVSAKGGTTELKHVCMCVCVCRWVTVSRSKDQRGQRPFGQRDPAMTLTLNEHFKDFHQLVSPQLLLYCSINFNTTSVHPLWLLDGGKNTSSQGYLSLAYTYKYVCWQRPWNDWRSYEFRCKGMSPVLHQRNSLQREQCCYWVI